MAKLDYRSPPSEGSLPSPGAALVGATTTFALAIVGTGALVLSDQLGLSHAGQTTTHVVAATAALVTGVGTPWSCRLIVSGDVRFRLVGGLLFIANGLAFVVLLVLLCIPSQ